MRTPEISYKKTQRTISTAGTFYTKGVLHHRQSAAKSLYTQRLLRQRNCTKQFLRRATFTPEDVYTWIVYIQKFLTPKPFLPANLYNNICLHQKPICTRYIAFDLTSHQRAFTPKPFYTKQCLHQKTTQCTRQKNLGLQSIIRTPRQAQPLSAKPLLQSFTPDGFYTRRCSHPKTS